MRKLPNRAVVYAKDVQNITGRSLRTAQHLLKRIKAYNNKEPSDFVTVMELSAFLKMDESLVREYLEG